MVEAFLWGAVSASALLAGAVVAYQLHPGRRLIAAVMAFGTGVLLGSVSFELIDEALNTRTVAAVSLLVLIGAGVFAVGDWALSRRGAGERKASDGAQAAGSPLAIVLGSVLDGIPESFVLGLTIMQGQISVALLAGIVFSNFPEGMASSSGLRVAKWPERRVLLMWVAVIVVSGVAAVAGYALLDPAHDRTGALVQAFAAGAVLAMLSNTLLPEAYEVEGPLTGPFVVAGFAASLWLSSLPLATGPVS